MQPKITVTQDYLEATVPLVPHCWKLQCGRVIRVLCFSRCTTHGNCRFQLAQLSVVTLAYVASDSLHEIS